jgi:hypothetical protein
MKSLTLFALNAECKEKLVTSTSLDVLALLKTKYIITLITTLNSCTKVTGATKSKTVDGKYVARKGKVEKWLGNFNHGTSIVQTG